jgi:hypothetical protein
MYVYFVASKIIKRGKIYIPKVKKLLCNELDQVLKTGL